MATKLQLVYIAGFFDGEGCISGRSDKKRRRVGISIAQRRPEVLYFIQKYLKIGHIYHNSQSGLWSFRIHDKDDIERFISLILPYSRVKNNELKIGRKLNSLAKLKITNSEEREKLYNELRRLKNV